MDTIVVGIDGSSGSRRALRWAFDEAVAHGAALQVVMAWEYEVFGALPGDEIAAPDEDRGPRMYAELESVVGAEIGEIPDFVELRPVYGTPAEALLEAAAGADLLVVGSRGISGLKRLVLGSVSNRIAHHAHLPVVIVPTPDEDHGS